MESKSTITVSDYHNFFQHYESFAADLAKFEVAEFISSFNKFTTQYEILIDKASRKKAQYDLVNAPDFNVFQILGVEHLEDQTHTPFIAELLDPNGRHGQGFLYLSSFLNYCRKKYKNFPVPESDYENEKWLVQVEYSTSYGIPDIVVRCESLDYLFVIENKIWAAEGENQLQSYYKWMKSVDDAIPKEALIFLTPWGREAESGPAISLSYQEDIVSWLESVKANSEKVQGIVEQYIRLLMLLTNHNSLVEERMTFENEIIKFLNEPENLPIALDISNKVKILKAKFQYEFWLEIFDELQERIEASDFSENWCVDRSPNDKLNKEYAKCWIKPINAQKDFRSPYLRPIFEQGTKQGKYPLYYGIVMPDHETEERNIEQVKELRNRLKKAGFKSSGGWPGYRKISYDTSSDQFMMRMAEDREAFISEIAGYVWNLFIENRPLLEEANHALAKALAVAEHNR